MDFSAARLSALSAAQPMAVNHASARLAAPILTVVRVLTVLLVDSRLNGRTERVSAGTTAKLRLMSRTRAPRWGLVQGQENQKGSSEKFGYGLGAR